MCVGGVVWVIAIAEAAFGIIVLISMYNTCRGEDAQMNRTNAQRPLRAWRHMIYFFGVCLCINRKEV